MLLSAPIQCCHSIKYSERFSRFFFLKKKSLHFIFIYSLTLLSQLLGFTTHGPRQRAIDRNLRSALGDAMAHTRGPYARRDSGRVCTLWTHTGVVQQWRKYKLYDIHSDRQSSLLFVIVFPLRRADAIRIWSLSNFLGFGAPHCKQVMLR